jgi:hypothetical protein
MASPLNYRTGFAVDANRDRATGPLYDRSVAIPRIDATGFTGQNAADAFKRALMRDADWIMHERAYKQKDVDNISLTDIFAHYYNRPIKQVNDMMAYLLTIPPVMKDIQRLIPTIISNNEKFITIIEQMYPVLATVQPVQSNPRGSRAIRKKIVQKGGLYRKMGIRIQLLLLNDPAVGPVQLMRNIMQLVRSIETTNIVDGLLGIVRAAWSNALDIDPTRETRYLTPDPMKVFQLQKSNFCAGGYNNNRLFAEIETKIRGMPNGASAIVTCEFGPSYLQKICPGGVIQGVSYPVMTYATNPKTNQLEQAEIRRTDPTLKGISTSKGILNLIEVMPIVSGEQPDDIIRFCEDTVQLSHIYVLGEGKNDGYHDDLDFHPNTVKRVVHNPQKGAFEKFGQEEAIIGSGIYANDRINSRTIYSKKMEEFIDHLNKDVGRADIEFDEYERAGPPINDDEYQEEIYKEDNISPNQDPDTQSPATIKGFRNDPIMPVPRVDGGVHKKWMWPNKLGCLRAPHVPSSIFTTRAQQLQRWLFKEKHHIAGDTFLKWYQLTVSTLKTLYNAPGNELYWISLIREQFRLNPVVDGSQLHTTGEVIATATAGNVRDVYQWKHNEYGSITPPEFRLGFPSIIPGMANKPGIETIANLPSSLGWTHMTHLISDCKKIISEGEKFVSILSEVLPTSELLDESNVEPWWQGRRTKLDALFGLFSMGAPLFMAYNSEIIGGNYGVFNALNGYAAGEEAGAYHPAVGMAERAVVVTDLIRNMKPHHLEKAESKSHKFDSRKDLVQFIGTAGRNTTTRTSEGFFSRSRPAKVSKKKLTKKDKKSEKVIKEKKRETEGEGEGEGEDEYLQSRDNNNGFNEVGAKFRRHHVDTQYFRAPLTFSKPMLDLIGVNFNSILPADPQYYYKTHCAFVYDAIGLTHCKDALKMHPDYHFVDTTAVFCSRLIRSIIPFYPDTSIGYQNYGGPNVPSGTVGTPAAVNWQQYIKVQRAMINNYGSIDGVPGYYFGVLMKYFRHFQFDLLSDRFRAFTHSMKNVDPITRIIAMAMMLSDNSPRQLNLIANNAGPIIGFALINFASVTTGSMILILGGSDTCVYVISHPSTTADVDPIQQVVHIQTGYKGGPIITNFENITLIPNAFPLEIEGGFGVTPMRDPNELRKAFDQRTPGFYIAFPPGESKMSFPLDLFNKPGPLNEEMGYENNRIYTKNSGFRFFTFAMGLVEQEIDKYDSPSFGLLTNRDRISRTIHRGSYDRWDRHKESFTDHISSNGYFTDDMFHPSNHMCWKRTGESFKSVVTPQ